MQSKFKAQVVKRDKSDSVLYHICILHHMHTVHTISVYAYGLTIHVWYGNSYYMHIWWYITAAEAQSSAQRCYTSASKGAFHLLLLYHRAEVFKMVAWLLLQLLTLQISSKSVWYHPPKSIYYWTFFLKNALLNSSGVLQGATL